MKMRVLGGTRIETAIAEAIEKAAQDDDVVWFMFNGVRVNVRADSNEALLSRDWARALAGCIAKDVGPYPRGQLTEEELAHDAKVYAENEARQIAALEAFRAETKEREKVVASRLKHAPELQLRDPAAWAEFKEKNQDDYGGATLAYAERWARLMQQEMVGGKALAEIADPTSHEADTEGITGFMHSVAASVLVRCWAHGEELRQWRNAWLTA